MRANKLYAIFAAFIMLFFLSLGVLLRVDIPASALTENTVAFYYSRAEYLEKNGHYLKEDSKTFAQYSYKENYPPFPAYIAVPIYRLVEPLGMDFKKFIIYFPVFIYIATFFVGLMLVKSLYGLEPGLFFSIIYSVAPVAVKSTSKAYYTEEALGILLIILTLCYTAKIKKFDYNFLFAVSFFTLLSLTWQVFILVDLAVVALALANIKNKRLLAAYSLLVVIPFILGHIFSIHIVGIGYSPVYIAKESLIALQNNDSGYFKIAFDRVDLQMPGIRQVFNEFGHISVFLILIGFAYLILNFNDNKNRAFLFAGLIAAGSFLMSSKFRFFASAPLIIAGSLGAGYLSNFSKLKKREKNAILIVAGLIAMIYIFSRAAAPLCSVDLEAPEKIEAGKYYELAFNVKNMGFDPLCDNKAGKDHAFGGINIEIENAAILNTSMHPNPNNSSFLYRVPYLNINWFEAKFDCLRRNKNMTVSVWIKPRNDKVSIYYRCWLPKKYCAEEPPIGIKPQYKTGWRNEECIERYPKDGSLCPVKVFAGYFEKRDYYCTNKTLR